MLRQLAFSLLTVLLCGGSVRAELLYTGGNTGDGNDHLFTYSGSTLVNTSERPLNAMGNPGQIAIGADGNVYIVDQDPFNGAGVDRFDGTTGQFIDQYLVSSVSNGISPTGLAWGPDGKLYIGDASTDTVSSFDGTTLTEVIAGNAGLLAPEGMTFGPGGFLYIADAGAGIIFRWDGTTLIPFTSMVGSGGAFFDVAIGVDGNLYVTDTTNGTVEVFRASDGFHLGQFNTGLILAQPTGLAFAQNGDLYVADDNGVKVFDSAGIFQSQLIQFDSNPGDQSTGQFLAFSSIATPEPAPFLLSALGLLVIGAAALRYRRVNL